MSGKRPGTLIKGTGFWYTCRLGRAVVRGYIEGLASVPLKRSFSRHHLGTLSVTELWYALRRRSEAANRPTYPASSPGEFTAYGATLTVFVPQLWRVIGCGASSAQRGVGRVAGSERTCLRLSVSRLPRPRDPSPD
jgi:hypothetical protein